MACRPANGRNVSLPRTAWGRGIPRARLQVDGQAVRRLRPLGLLAEEQGPWERPGVCGRLMIMSSDLAQKSAAYSELADRQRPAAGAPAIAEIDEDKTKRTRRHLLRSCRHSRDAHRHYRPGSDCALCECPRWSPWNLVPWLAHIWAR
jgi:hypothetical protein